MGLGESGAAGPLTRADGPQGPFRYGTHGSRSVIDEPGAVAFK
jgi:hypothetical protein